MRAALRCPEDTLSTDIWPMAMDYAVWVYNRIPDIQSVLSAIEIWSRSGLNQCQKPLSTVIFGVVQHMFRIKAAEAWSEDS